VAGPFQPLSIGKDSFRPPDAVHLMGTDDLGRDLLSGILWGSRVSLLVGLLAALTSTGIGVIVGSVAAYYGHRWTTS